jgi:hypothetical protein
MPDPLDELEMRPAEDQDRQGSEGSRPRRPGPHLTSMALALLALVVLAAVGISVFRYQPWRSPKPAAPTPAPTASGQAPSAELQAPLPPLDASDEYARRIAAGISAHPELARWLAQAGLVRTLTAVVSNIADGETPRPHLGFLAPRQRFRAMGARGRTVADPAGFADYDTFGDAVASIDAHAAATAYRALEPLFDAAYRDLGHPEGFRGALERAIMALLAVPVLPSNAELVHHAIGFRWADPRLESLTAAQKQFLRIGPRNQQLLQAKLRELQTALASALPPGEASPEQGHASPDPKPATPGPSARL